MLTIEDYQQNRVRPHLGTVVNPLPQSKIWLDVDYLHHVKRILKVGDDNYIKGDLVWVFVIKSIPICTESIYPGTTNAYNLDLQTEHGWEMLNKIRISYEAITNNLQTHYSNLI